MRRFVAKIVARLNRSARADRVQADTVRTTKAVAHADKVIRMLQAQTRANRGGR